MTDFRVVGGARRSIAVLLLILLAVGLCSALHAVAKPFWYDEICTVIISRLPGPSEIWNALDHAADTQPPAYYLVTRFARQLVQDDHLGYRLPSILGLMGTVFCIYIILSRRVSRLSAMVGATFVLCTPLAAYAYEARPYSLMIACISCAILAWQRIEDSWRYALLAVISLAAAVSLHYYAILVFPAFIVAEASVWIFHRRFRAGAWASIVAGALPLLFFSKLLFKLHQAMAPNFWAQPSFMQVLTAPNWLFYLGHFWGFTFSAGITAIFLYFDVAKTAAPGEPGRRPVEEKALTIGEQVLILMLLWLPVIAVVAAKITHGGMTERYMMPTILGGALAFGYLSGKVPRAVGAILLVLFLTSYALSSVRVVKNAVNGSLLDQRNAAIHEGQAIVAEYDGYGMPIVISNLIRYFPMAYYTPAPSNRKLYVLVESPDPHSLVLTQYTSIGQVEGYGGFVSRHREFLVVAGAGGGPGEGVEWLPARLAREGNTVMLLSATAGTEVYKVTMMH
ncbi:MAG: glycosyltransferase family 39 protein [Terracidiphilus sp.]